MADISAYSVILILICILGVVGNLIVLITILILKEYKKSVTHWYILQLAIADTLFLLTIPFTVSKNMNNSYWFYGEGMCKTVEGIFFINYYTSITFLMIMSADRYFAVCKPFSPSTQKFRKINFSYVVSASVWIFSILLSIPIIYFSTLSGVQQECICRNDFRTEEQVYQECLKTGGNTERAIEFCSRTDPRDEGRCRYNVNRNEQPPNLFLATGPTNASPFIPGLNNQNGMELNPQALDFLALLKNKSDENSNPEPIFDSSCSSSGQPLTWNAYVWFNFIVMFVLPILLISVFYGLIARKFWKTQIGNNSGQQINADKDRKRVTIMCVVLVASFTLCWILFHAVHLAKLYFIKLTKSGCESITEASFAFTYLNSALNPYLYSFLGTGCQRKIKMLKEKAGVQPTVKTKTKSTKLLTLEPSKDRSRVGSAGNMEQNNLVIDSNSQYLVKNSQV